MSLSSNFTGEINISVSRNKDGFDMWISSDYTHSNHKGKLYFSKRGIEGFCDEVSQVWRNISTKKLQKMSVGFGEIDYYDSMTNIYEIPNFHIERGLKKTRVGYSEHGDIPKDWSFDVHCSLLDTTTSTPFVDVLKQILGYKFRMNEKVFMKQLKPVLQKKENSMNFSY